MQTTASFIIPKAKCLTCTFLVEVKDVPTVENDCLDHSGCPAKGVKIIKGCNQTKAATQIAEAFLAGDFELMGELSARLGTYHPVVRGRIAALVRQKLADSTVAAPDAAILFDRFAQEQQQQDVAQPLDLTAHEQTVAASFSVPPTPADANGDDLSEDELDALLSTTPATPVEDGAEDNPFGTDGDA